MVLLYDNYELLESKSDMLKTMGHPIRLSIVQLLSEHAELTVTEIYTTLKIEQAVASHHLRILKNGNILSSTKSGKNAYYSLVHDNIKKIFNLLLDF